MWLYGSGDFDPAAFDLVFRFTDREQLRLGSSLPCRSSSRGLSVKKYRDVDSIDIDFLSFIAFPCVAAVDALSKIYDYRYGELLDRADPIRAIWKPSVARTSRQESFYR